MGFRNLALKYKLIAIQVATASLVLALMGILVVWNDISGSRTSMVNTLSSVSAIIGKNTVSALFFLDSDTASEILNSLQVEPHVVHACIYDDEGKVFAVYHKEGVFDFPLVQVDGHTFEPAHLVLFHTIVFNEEKVGTVYLRSDLELLEQKIYSYIWKAIVILCVGILIALILSLLLQRMISRPVVHLVETTKEVSETGDYMQRVTKESNDELGVLCDEFNAMLQLIQEREDKLREARDTLEKRVELRTQELSEMNTELIVARDQALESSHAKSDFLATMSHEIRTPMNGILGMAELLIGTKLDHTQQSFLNIIDSSAKELLEILNDILDLSKIEAGKMALEIIDFSLKDCLNGIIRMMAVRAQEKGLELACHISPDVQDGLSGDPTRLRQIIVNLLSNALKFTKEGEIVLRVKQTSQIEETVSLQFDVSDTGIGISSEMEKKIFEAFTQADSSTARQFGGTGLGLTISSQLVQMMDGRIWVDSEIGKGSIFSFIAKFGILETEKKESQTVGVDSETDISTGSDARLDVLVVEDNRVNQRVATLMLNKLGHSVSVANNGIEALECIEAGGYDLIFMDMQMPVMDGLETTIKVREREQKTGKHIPIVAMTANAMQGDRERCLEAGMDDYVSKPIHRDVVIEAIKRVGDRFWKGGDETES